MANADHNKFIHPIALSQLINGRTDPRRITRNDARAVELNHSQFTVRIGLGFRFFDRRHLGGCPARQTQHPEIAAFGQALGFRLGVGANHENADAGR